ncbi:AIR synthase-related protein [Mediterraneibacter gnavus]|uniref:AIR synthase-related protein n=1 Tax=Mediterraneibacter gnavus TaxID=33038 RepID=UPI00232FAFD2|nr:AIR synthase-related protein [Mediterraneibacter gnavus]MDB8711223.1 AIR synthase-related protein [Mediterraneibacter gnavus]MDB8713600.1 AIR synthase-related protein [Mediterraneibacter gnavus]
MKVGNISQTVLKRSVLKQLHTRRDEILTEPSVEEMCTAVQIKDTEDSVYASAVVSGNSRNIGVYGILRAVLDLETRGAHAIGVSVQVILPTYAYESRLKEMFRCMEEKCAAWGIAMTCAKAEVSPAVSQAVVSVTAVGSVTKGEFCSLDQAGADQEIVLCGSIGVEGVLRILDERNGELSKRFVPAFIRQIRGMERETEILEALRIAAQMKTTTEKPLVTAMQQIGSGGILASLWELTEAANVGMQIEMSRISIRQECVEVCEYYHLNPYQMTSAGTVLMVTRDGSALVRCLEESGARASVLGVTTADHAKVITSGDEVRYLDRPAPDELMRWWEEQAQKEVRSE